MITVINSNVVNKTQDFAKLNSMFQNVELTAKELLDHVLEGHAFCTCQLKNNADGYCNRKNENFISSGVIALDIDNTKHILDASGNNVKAKVSVNEYLTYNDIIKDDFIRKNASFVYTSFSHTAEWNRFRIVFILKNDITDPVKHKKIFKVLNTLFSGDDATSATAQVFFGATNAEFQFYGNILDDTSINELLAESEIETDINSGKSKNSDFDSKSITKEELITIVKFIFKNGKLPNQRWYKVPTILKNTGLFTDNEIIDLIQEAVGDTNDIATKLKYAHRYKDKLNVGTLIFYARENGYELPEEISNTSKTLSFWQINNKNSKSGQVSSSTNIIYHLFTKFLVNNGFRILVHEKGFQLVQFDDEHQIEQVSELSLRQFVFDFIRKTNQLSKKERFSVEEQIQKHSNFLFSTCIMNLQVFNKELDAKLVQDKSNQVYFFYQNGFKKITKTTDEFFDYSKLNGFIWKKSVLKRSYKKSDSQIAEFETFIRCVCTTKNDDGSLDFNEEKFKTMKSALGYLLSRFKKRTETIGIVLCDEIIADCPEGGSGKSIATEALGRMRNITTIDGRFFDPQSQFRFETVNESTEIVNLDDCSQKFAFDKLFHAITGDITVEKKGVSRFTIPFDKAPKLCFSTNHTFSGSGNSHKRRVFEIEFSQYFNAKHRPLDEFGHCLFDDWNEFEWNRFDDFMADCVKFYLNNGLVKYNQVNLGWKKLVENTSQPIAEYLDNYIKPNMIYLADKVCEDLNQIMKMNYSQSRITKSVHYWAEKFKNYYFENEFNRRLNTTIFVVSTDIKNNLSYFKRQDQFKNITKTGTVTTPSDMSDFDFNELFG
jgi:hypothetical protein